MDTKKTDEAAIMLNIKKEDFKERMPTKMDICRLFAENLYRLSNIEHIKTHEQIYDEIEEAHIYYFGRNLPFASFDSFRKYYTKGKRIY